MADPILPDFFRAQAIFHGRSGMPEDVYVNSFVFRNDESLGLATVAERINTAISDFYFLPVAPATATPWSYMNQGNITAFSVKVYDLGQPPPRNPQIITRQDPLPATQVGTLGLPYEVAACLSLRTSTRTPRGRGRIYIGPLTTGAITEALATGVRVNDAFRDVLIAGATRLMTGNAQNVLWHVLSGRDAAARAVIGGYVDDAFDTQRRRGNAPESRTTWGTVI